MDVNNHIILDAKIGMGSSDLRDVFSREVPSANDTSFGVGYAPLSETEMIVYNSERELMNLKKSIPAIGEDIKVMGMRQGDIINLTIACAMVDKYVANLKDTPIQRTISWSILQSMLSSSPPKSERSDECGRQHRTGIGVHHSHGHLG